MVDNQKFQFQDNNSIKKIFSLRKRLRVVCGGTAAGKTIGILVWLIDYAQTTTGKKIDVLAESIPHLKDGAIRDFKQIMIDRNYWKDDRWNSSDHQYTFEGGSVIKFISIDKLGKAHGPRRDVLFINEANNTPFDIYDQLEVRTKEVVWIDYNPSTEFWYYTHIRNNKDHDFLTLTYKDCIEVLDPRIVESIESHKDNKNWWQVYGLGQLGIIEGRIYKNWQEIGEIPHEARLWRRGLDFGYSVDPTVLIDIYEYNGGFILDERLYQKGLSNKGIADFINSLDGNAMVVADSAEPKSIDELASYGINILGATKGPGSVEQGIQFVQGQPISITQRSLRTIKAYRNYMWAQDKRTGRFLTVPDDTIHEWSNPCLVGNTKILLSNGKQKNIKDIKIGEYVKTQKGNKKVIDVKLTQKNAEIYELKLTNGYKLKATGNHKIYTQRGKVAVDSLRDDDIIQILNQDKISVWKKLLYTTERNIIKMVDIIQDIYQEKKEKDQANYYIEKYGKKPLERFPKVSIYTIKTRIQPTTKSIILNLLKLKNIIRSIQKECGSVKDLRKRWKDISKLLVNLRSSGIPPKKEENGIKNTEKNVGIIENRSVKNVKSVGENIKHIFLKEVNFAIRIAERKRCGREDVYNLTVEKEHNYYANKILVANCDSIRYGFNGQVSGSKVFDRQQQQFIINQNRIKNETCK